MWICGSNLLLQIAQGSAVLCFIAAALVYSLTATAAAYLKTGWQSFISSYRGHSVDEHECTENSLISCMLVCFYVSAQTIGQMVMVGPMKKERKKENKKERKKERKKVRKKERKKERKKDRKKERKKSSASSLRFGPPRPSPLQGMKSVFVQRNAYN